MNERRVALENACGEFEADLVLYYYGEGSQAERLRVESHLEACQRCSDFLDDLRGLLSRMSQETELPQTFWDNYYREVVNKLDRERERRSWWRNLIPSFGAWAVPAFGTAAVAVLAVALVFGKGDWSLRWNPAQQESIPQEILSDSSRLEFFESMELLETLAALENMDGSRKEPAQVRSL
jgi:predicted anti-sigma-YlaC factor YlaD